MNYTWVQPWHRPIIITEKPGRVPAIKSFDIRVRPDIAAKVCQGFPHGKKGPVSLRDPYRVYSPFWDVSGRAWRFRIRPDLATRVYPSFPKITDECKLAWRAWHKAHPVEVWV